MSMVMNHPLSNDVSEVYQDDVNAADIQHNVTLNKVLGKGTYGTAYLAHWAENNKRVVAKFSNYFLRNNIILVTADGKIHYNKSLRHIALQGVQDMTVEYRNAVRILAPYYYNSIAKDYHDDNFKLNHISTAHFEAIQQEARKLRIHPGYIHLHKIVHFSQELACIFSEYCKGSLWDMITDEKQLSQSTLRSVSGIQKLNRDIGFAVDYLLNVASVAHLDIKPENILYQVNEGNGALEWKLSDFGLCQSLDHETQAKPRDIMGTALYLPEQLLAVPTQQRPIIFAADLTMMYSYALTIFEAMSSFWHNEFRYLSQIVGRPHTGLHWKQDTRPSMPNSFHHGLLYLPDIIHMLDVLMNETNYLNPDPVTRNQTFIHFRNNLTFISNDTHS